MECSDVVPSAVKDEMFLQELETCISANNVNALRKLLKTDIGKQTDLRMILLGDNRPLAHKVAIESATDVIDVLVELNIPLNDPDPMRDQFWHRRPIHHAASGGKTEIVKKLLQEGVPVNTRDNDGRTSLHWACISGQLETARFLVAMGATVDIKQNDGFTPLHAAITLNHYNICEFLISKGADVNQTDHLGYTALLTACCYGYTDLAHLFLTNGALVNAMTSQSENSLHLSADGRYTECIQLLLDAGIHTNVLNFKGETALIMACKGEKDGYDIVNSLIKQGIDINVRDPMGASALYYSVIYTHTRSAMSLLKSGCDLSNEDWIRKKQFPIYVKLTNEWLCNLLYEMATNPSSLKQACLNRVRKCVGSAVQNVKRLPLPKVLQNIILYSDI